MRWVFSDVSMEHSPSSSGTAMFFLDSLPLKMKAAQSRITATSHPMTRYHMTENLDPLQYHCENLNFHIIISHYCTKDNGIAGRSLHYIGHALRLCATLEISPSREGFRSYVLGRAGDCCFMIVQDWAQVDMHREVYAHCTSVHCDIMVGVVKDMATLGTSVEGAAGDSECKAGAERWAVVTGAEIGPESTRVVCGWRREIKLFLLIQPH